MIHILSFILCVYSYCLPYLPSLNWLSLKTFAQGTWKSILLFSPMSIPPSTFPVDSSESLLVHTKTYQSMAVGTLFKYITMIRAVCKPLFLPLLHVTHASSELRVLRGLIVVPNDNFDWFERCVYLKHVTAYLTLNAN